MPGRDGSGPMGLGPMTGKCAPLCNGNRFTGRGMGWACAEFGFGAGMAMRRGWRSTAFESRFSEDPNSKNDEITILKNQAKLFGEALEGINIRISEIEMGKQ